MNQRDRSINPGASRRFLVSIFRKPAGVWSRLQPAVDAAAQQMSSESRVPFQNRLAPPAAIRDVLDVLGRIARFPQAHRIECEGVNLYYRGLSKRFIAFIYNDLRTVSRPCESVAERTGKKVLTTFSRPAYGLSRSRKSPNVTVYIRTQFQR